MAKALIVSADENSRYLYRVAIAFQKIEVETAKTIKAAIKQILHKFPDIVIMDLETIDMNDIPLFKEVKKKRKSLPVIIMADMSQKKAEKEACVLGACKVLADKEATLGNLIRSTRKRVLK